MPWIVNNVRVREQKYWRAAHLQPLTKRPELAGPFRRFWLSVDYIEVGRRAGERRGSVRGIVIHQYHAKLPG